VAADFSGSKAATHEPGVGYRRLFLMISGCYGWLFFAVVFLPLLARSADFRGLCRCPGGKALYYQRYQPPVLAPTLISRIGRIPPRGHWRD
jgi:hypothetical protein